MILLSLPSRTDRDLYPALMSPELNAKYPTDHKAFVRIDTSLRMYWHTLFDICPELLELSGLDGMSIFRPFMAWAGEKKLAFDWSYYLWVYAWLRQSPFKERLLADDKYLRSVMAALRRALGDPRSRQRLRNRHRMRRHDESCHRLEMPERSFGTRDRTYRTRGAAAGASGPFWLLHAAVL